MNHEEMILVIKAAHEGKQIETRPIGSGEPWVFDPHPAWDFAKNKYRVKPEPRDFWVIRRVNAAGIESSHGAVSSEDKAHGIIDTLDKTHDEYEIIHTREVVDQYEQ